MGQDLVMICHTCKFIKFMNCRFRDITKSKVQDYFNKHKGHNIMACGDDGGWDLRISEYEDKGYKE